MASTLGTARSAVAAEGPAAGSRAVAPSPLTGMRFYVDPHSHASRQAAEWARSRPADAAHMQKLAGQPQADWFGDWNSDIKGAVAQRAATVRAAGAVPLFVAYNIPVRDCGSYSAGGSGSPDAYRRWIQSFSEGLGNGPAVVILEPDAIAAADCLTPAQREDRFNLIRDAVSTLKSRPGRIVYIDAGHAAWMAPAEAAKRLTQAGVGQADGFALNVSNVISNAENVRYGKQVSAALSGAHFVIDTSRNGLGSDAARTWCNPEGRALGEAPTAQTGHAEVDAYFWIKRPGESDGTCNGGPAAGQWWADYALGLAARSSVGSSR